MAGRIVCLVLLLGCLYFASAEFLIPFNEASAVETGSVECPLLFQVNADVYPVGALKYCILQ